MVFLSWTRPSPEEQRACINKSGSFNYDNRFRGATEKPAPLLKQDRELAKDGFSVNCARVLVGSGLETFEKGKAALQNWRHFGLNWAFVDPKAPIKSGTKFCVCVKEFFPWLMMPLQVVYVTENKNSKNGASFSFGSGTLQGHLLTYRKCECEFINHGTVNYGHFLGHSPSSPTTKKKKIEMVIYICFLFMTQKRNMQPILLFCSHLSRFYEMHNFVATMLKGLLVPGIVTIMQLV